MLVGSVSQEIQVMAVEVLAVEAPVVQMAPGFLEEQQMVLLEIMIMVLAAAALAAVVVLQE